MQQFSQMGFPQMYEQALVPPLFRPWAEDLIAELDVAAASRALDIACGTGIVARLAKARAGQKGKVVGVDSNAAMLSVAREIAPDIDWRQGDAGSLPVPEDEKFDVVLCQQGVQFFPDRVAAAAEMRRVLDPNGRLGVSAWRADEEMPVLSELRHIAEKHVGAIADRRHSFPEADDLEQLFVDAGFRNVRVEPKTRMVRFVDGSAFVFLNAMALIGMSAAAGGLDEEARAEAAKAIASDSQRVVEANTRSGAFEYEISANIAIATG